MFVTLSRLGIMLADLAGPLFGGTPAKATVDKTVKEVEGQVDPKVRAGGDPSPEPLAISAVVSTSQVIRMNATPPVAWDSTASAWMCESDTCLQVAFADGVAQTYRYPEGTAIRVAAGMIHFPRCEPRSDPQNPED
jgi:hypothetical protein